MKATGLLSCLYHKCYLWAAQIQPLTPLVDEFASRLFGELDYVQEGLNAEKFQVGYNPSSPVLCYLHASEMIMHAGHACLNHRQIIGVQDGTPTSKYRLLSVIILLLCPVA